MWIHCLVTSWSKALQIFQEFRSHPRIISTRRVTWSEFHTEDHIQNVVAWATWHTGFVYPCFQTFDLGCMYISYSWRVCCCGYCIVGVTFCCFHMTCCASVYSKRILLPFLNRTFAKWTPVFSQKLLYIPKDLQSWASKLLSTSLEGNLPAMGGGGGKKKKNKKNEKKFVFFVFH